MQQIFGAGTFTDSSELNIIFNCPPCLPFQTCVTPFLPQTRARVTFSATLTCLNKTTSPGRGYCCSQRTTCETSGSSPKVTPCTLRQVSVWCSCSCLGSAHIAQNAICARWAHSESCVFSLAGWDWEACSWLPRDGPLPTSSEGRKFLEFFFFF